MISPRILRLFAYVVIIAAFYTMFVTVPLQSFKDRGIDIIPPEAGDGVDYEHLAFNVSKGRGLINYWSDEEWRYPFLRYQNDPLFQGIVDRTGKAESTAYRPPLYPLTLGIFYKFVGRNFYFARLLNFLFFFGAILITAVAAKNLSGAVSGLWVLLLSLLDPALPFWSYYLMTEPLATLLTAVLFYLLIEHQRQPQRNYADFMVGIVSGFLIVCRSITLLWVPSILFLVAYKQTRLASRSALRLSSLFFLGLMLPVSCWIFHNVVQVGYDAALGTQAGPNLAADYSDAMIESGGLWTSSVWKEVRAPFVNNPELDKLKGLSRERAANTWAKEAAATWLTQNWIKFPRLFYLKLRGLWWDVVQPYHFYLAILSLASIFFVKRHPVLIVPIVLIAANSFAVSLTHNVPAGRFLIPIVPCLYFLVGVTASELLKKVLLKLRHLPTFRS